MMHHQYEWNWMNCNLALKRANKNNQNQIYQILQSEYVVEVEGEQTQTQLNIEILMEKRINFDEKSGFTWHKSWNIPSIQIKISKRDLNSIKTQLGVHKVYCQMTSGYPQRRNIEFFIQEIVLEGQTRKEVGANGSVRFNNLKFSETSFNHQRKKFSLILIVYAKNEDKTKAILKSFISMPMYVDSRKQARKKKATNSILSKIISKQDFKEDLQKRHQNKRIMKNKLKNKKIQKNQQFLQSNQSLKLSTLKFKIQYSLDGFLKYYSSAHIRNKIKHPFYFTYHFYPLLTLYYNQQVASSPIELLKLLEKSCNVKNNNQKSLLIALTFVKEEQQEIKQEIKKKMAILFQNWKYFFIQVVVKDSFSFNSMLQGKITDKQYEKPQQKRWILIERQQLYSSYIQYFEDYQKRQLQDINSESSKILHQNQIINENKRKCQHFQLHQIINIQQAFHNHENQPTTKVKVQINSSQN